MTKAIIFDCFGVIISDALSVMTDELSRVNPSARERVRALVERANTGRLTPLESSTQISKLFGMTYDEYRAQVQQNEIRNQELLDYIVTLRLNYKTALLSNIPKGSLSRRFSDEEFSHYFDIVVASGEIGHVKPEARAYEIVAERLGVRLDECIFTDDRQPYCDGARAVGMHTILYQNFPQFRADLERLLADS